ncbi:hypothetical protein [Oryzibacter oryziterrae]|uniref:hypothetical protein n=1 Tax=Oryzibacter oryziterrae TaxID=2766474 RepID=UPI001F1ECB9D|nr:hypothetical protein [Oryzibacter oryziterrae]
MAYRVHSIATYGTASKWSMEAVKSRGTSASSASASANDIFFGPAQTGTDWGAAFLNATSTDEAMADYVKRNYDKFKGATLQAMLESTNLVDWYKSEMQKKIAEGQKKLAESQASLGDISEPMFDTRRTQSILSSLAAPTSSKASGASAVAAPDTAGDGTTTVTDGTSGTASDGTSSTDATSGSTSSSTGTDTSSTASDSSQAPGSLNLLV